jgi:hypothetical protein
MRLLRLLSLGQDLLVLVRLMQRRPDARDAEARRREHVLHYHTKSLESPTKITNSTNYRSTFLTKRRSTRPYLD